MRTLMLIWLAGCDASLAPAPDGALPDLARASDLADGLRDLSQKGDGAPADMADAGDAGCPSGRVSNGSGCVPIQSPTACADENRQYIGVGMVGYCGDCLAGYEQQLGYCVTPGCATGDDTLGSLCARLGRTCDSGACSPCLPGFSDDPATHACVHDGDCAHRSDCPEGAGFYCTQLTINDAPRCHAAKCPTGQMWDRFAQGCRACNCGSGAAWPVSDRGGSCYCQPADGSYYNSTSLRTLACDADGDGWLHKEVQDELKRASQAQPYDYTVILNVRCAIPQFTQVVLRNEWDQDKTLELWELQLTAAVVPMYEHPLNDTGDNPFLPLVPHSGAPLAASSVNSLTKACHSTDLDLNRNGIADLNEDQAHKSDASEAWSWPYQKLTHFLELYTVSFEATGTATQASPCVGCNTLPMAAINGVLVIKERSRCNDFPMAPSGSDYWRECTRRRDGGFVASQPLAYDFASFECDGSDACTSYSWPGFIANPGNTLPPPIDEAPMGQVPPHGLCDGGSLPAGADWRGMTHYSQFMCARVVEGIPMAKNEITAVDPRWEPEACQLDAQPSASPAPGTHAEFSCTAGGSLAVGVTWVARGFDNYPVPGQYTGGCIDEGAEWKQLCPGNRPLIIGNENAYGSILCGPACAPREVFYGGGYWLCAHPTASVAEPWTAPSPGPAWQVSGEFSIGASGTKLGGPSGFSIQ